MNWTAFAALVRKDLQLFFTDKRSVVMSFVAPIAIATFFGFIFSGGSREKHSAIPVAVVNLDDSEIAKAVVERLAKEESLQLHLLPEEAARKLVREGDLHHVAVFPKGFGEQAGRAFFGSGGKPVLKMLYDPSRGAEKEMVKGILTGQVMQAVGKEMFGGLSGQRLAREALDRLDEIQGMNRTGKRALKQLLEGVGNWNSTRQPGRSGGPEMSMPYEVQEEAVTARKDAGWNGFTAAFTGMGVQFILFMGIEAGISVLVQRQRGLWKRLRAAPVSRGVLLGSRAVSAAISAMLILAALFAFARVVFGVKIEGSFAGFVLVGIALALMTASFGLLVAAFGKTPEATRPLAILATLIMVMLGGSWVPTFLFPGWLQTLTLVMPTRWAVDGLNAMTWRGLGFNAALPPVAVLLGFTALFGFVAVERFRWEGD